MPRYNYLCEACTVQKYVDSTVDGLSIFIATDSENPHAEPLVWEVIHGMSEDPPISCPVCGQGASRTMLGVKVSSFIKGNFLLNTEECRGLSDIHKLKFGDPYGEHRESGEADDKISNINRRLKRAHNWKADRHKENEKIKTKRRKKKTIDLGGKKSTTIQ